MYVFLQIFIEVYLFEEIFSVNIYRYFIIYLIECIFFLRMFNFFYLFEGIFCKCL